MLKFLDDFLLRSDDTSDCPIVHPEKLREKRRSSQPLVLHGGTSGVSTTEGVHTSSKHPLPRGTDGFDGGEGVGGSPSTQATPKTPSGVPRLVHDRQRETSWVK